MTEEQKMVEEFHKAFQFYKSEKPFLIPLKEQQMRVTLIQEEFEELKMAFLINDLVGVADALGDLLYVVYGCAISCGIDMTPIFAEIHRSNMSKIGGIKREDGKLLKPKTYSPPDLKSLIENQIKR